MRGDWTAADIWPGVRGYFEARQDRTASRRPAAQINAPGLACRPPSSLVNGELIANVQPLTCMLLEHMIHVGECLEDDAIVAAWGANAQPTTCAVDAQVRKANHALLAVKAAKSMSRKGGYIILS